MSKENVLSVGGFYGSNKRKWLGLEKSIDATVKKHNAEKIPTAYPSRLLGPSTKWQTFFRQQDAFNCCRSTRKDLRVFAFESKTFDSNTGQRLYLVASYPVFWHYYSQLKDDKRQYYEVIPEGAVCKLYFDLEFSTPHNPQADGEKMVDTLIKYTCLSLEAEFKVTCTRADILDLDASTDTKFSRHLVFMLKKAVFQDNIHAGNFVQYILSQVSAKLTMSQVCSSDLDHNKLKDSSLKSVSDSTHLVTDSEPTSGNSVSEVGTKRTSTVISPSRSEAEHQLDTVATNTVSPGTVAGCEIQGASIGAASGQRSASNHNLDPKYEAVFQQISIEELKQLFVKNKHGQEVLFCDTGVYTKNRNFRLFLSSKLGKKNPLHVAAANKYGPTDPLEEHIFFTSLVANTEYHRSTRVLSFNQEVKLPGCPRQVKDKQASEESLDGYSMSPYPEVDQYVKGLITQHGATGAIRHWIYFQQGEMLIYEISRYRFCHNIGRQHQSNNIMYVVDLRRGVFYQKCHDPDCHQQNYKSEEWPLPRHVLPESYFDDPESEFDDLDMDDEELMNKTLELEKDHFGGQVPAQ